MGSFSLAKFGTVPFYVVYCESDECGHSGDSEESGGLVESGYPVNMMKLGVVLILMILMNRLILLISW